MNYSVDTIPCKKVTITITRANLWQNFATSWVDVVWDDITNKHLIDNVVKVLVPKYDGDKLNCGSLRNLFKDGLTCMLMGNAMDHIDNDEDNLVEIVVVDGEDKYIVRHEDISY